jgi:SAM-dependent methyltransferase
MAEAQFPGLDYDFLRYMEVIPENQQRIQSFYLPVFEKCRRVIDLGCGDGDFLILLRQHNIDAVGVDSDRKAYEAATAQGLSIVHADLFDYLRDAPGESADGIFCAHVVEHLPYEKVIELCRGCWRVLRPGGVIVLATPNVRTLFSHLEMFYLHYGHVSFYHPRLLCFFLDYAGFTDTCFGENPVTASPLLAEAQAIQQRQTSPLPDLSPPRLSFGYRRTIPMSGDSWLRRLSFHIKRWVAHWVVLPFLDDLVKTIDQEVNRQIPPFAAQVNRRIAELDGDVHMLANSLLQLNGAFECYARAYKPSVESAIPPNHQPAD